jgi:hypothetical protein
MQAAITVTPEQLPEVLLHVAVVRPVFLWGAPGIGKSEPRARSWSSPTGTATSFESAANTPG